MIGEAFTYYERGGIHYIVERRKPETSEDLNSYVENLIRIMTCGFRHAVVADYSVYPWMPDAKQRNQISSALAKHGPDLARHCQGIAVVTGDHSKKIGPIVINPMRTIANTLVTMSGLRKFTDVEIFMHLTEATAWAERQYQSRGAA